MIRIATFVCVLTLTAVPAVAGSAKDKRCEAFGAMSQELAEFRKDGLAETDAILKMAELHEGKPTETLQLIPYLSSFVYGLPEAQLSEDVGGAMAAQCKAA